MRSRAGVAGCVVLAGCTFHPGTGAQGDQHPQIVDDTSADFAAGTLGDVAVDPLGLLAPDAFMLGGLHARAYDIPGVTPTTTWAELQAAALGPLVGERYGELPVTNWGGDRPYGLGITTSHLDSFTVEYDGELYLPDGPTTLQLFADDYGFLELELGAITPSLHAKWTDNPAPTLTITPPHAGWFPIHGAVGEAGGNAAFQLSTVIGTTATPIPADRLRARTTNATGMLVHPNADRVFRTPIAGSSVEQTLVDRDWSSYQVPSYDLYGISNQNYALRYTGQLRVDQSELYVFGLDLGTPSTDYARLLVDGVPIAGHWPGGIDRLTADPIQLAPGWHDVLLDFSQYGGTAKLQLTASTPTSPARPIPADHLRPVRTGGILAAITAGNVQLADAVDDMHPGVSMVPLALAAPSDAIVDFVDLFFYLASEPRAGLQLQLIQPAGVDPMPMPPTPAFEGTYDYLPDRTMLAGTPASAGWSAVFTDTVHDYSAGQAQYMSLMASYHGGPNPPFAQQMTYVSAPHPTPGATSIDALSVTADLHGAQLAIAVRTGDAASIDAATWADVTAGAAPPVAAGELVQYRLTVISDGWSYPTIDRVVIDYTVAAR